MSKIRKSFLKGSAMMLAVMVLSSGVAQAQECAAFQSSPTDARAEGMTEAMGGIQLVCRPPQGFGVQPVPTTMELSITLNTQITNGTTDGVVDGLEYAGTLGASAFEGDDREELSGGNTITWEIPTSELTLGGDTGNPITITGIMADASAVGNGNDVTAEVSVNGVMIQHSPVKLADVTTGLMVTVTSADGLQCRVPMTGDTEGIMATIRFVEGFDSAFATNTDGTGGSTVVLDFSGIPDGVTVTPSATGLSMVSDGMATNPEDGRDLAAFTLQDNGVEDGEVELEDGEGSIRYLVGTSDTVTGGVEVATSDSEPEWNEITVTFEWEVGAPLGTGMVTASYHPVTDEADTTPRYVSGAPMQVVEVADCVTSMLFPFVTNQLGHDTGVALTNRSDVDGACMIAWSGDGAPMDDSMVMVGAESTQAFVVSAMAPGFQGYIDVTCDYRNGKGLAIITNGGGMAPTYAHGYVVGEDLESSD